MLELFRVVVSIMNIGWSNKLNGCKVGIGATSEHRDVFSVEAGYKAHPC